MYSSRDSLKNNRKSEWQLYSELVDSLYSPSSNIAISTISNELLLKIKYAISNGLIPEEKLVGVQDRLQEHLILTTDKHSLETENSLNENLRVLSLHRSSWKNELLREIHREARQRFSSDLGSPFIIVNSRMWITQPGTDRFGPNAYHTDGFEPGHLKCMIYISPLDIESGYFVFNDESGLQTPLINFPAGTAILFKNSEITHTGVPGISKPRICIELTIMRSIIDSEQIWAGHFYGRHLYTPAIFHHIEESLENAGESWLAYTNQNNLHVNIGSGARKWENWICLDELDFEGVTKIHFSSSVILPIEDNSTSLFYSSHCFEHLDDRTVERILMEIHRAGTPDSILVLKIPDYDYFLNRFRDDVSTSMIGKGVESVLPTWGGKISDTFRNRVSMMFCGYWNQAYGDHFVKKINNSSDAYHGPALLSDQELVEIFSIDSPKGIAEQLRFHAESDPGFFRFNHQNAWSRLEMKKLLGDNGFSVVTTNSAFIEQRFKHQIPDINYMATWSTFFVARKSS
jgi:predicted SAM-dependent methyltransferase